MTQKRSTGEGTIRNRADGRWEGRYTHDGKQHSVYGRTHKECADALRAITSEIDKDTFVPASPETLETALLNFLDAKTASGEWNTKTSAVHRDNIRLHLIPALGKIPVTSLTSQDVQNFVNAQVKSGVSAITVRKRLEPLQGVIRDWFESGKLARTPLKPLHLPRVEKKEIRYLTLEEQQKLLAALPDTTNARAVRVMLFLGLRVSEVCGLRWSDVNLDGNTLTVRQAAQYVSTGKEERENGAPKSRLFIHGTKTNAGLRTVPILPAVKTLLEEQKRTQAQERLTAGPAWKGKRPCTGETPVFASAFGTYADRSNIARTLRNALKTAGLESRGVHALRHSFCTNWINSGADPRSLSAIAGHAKVSFTLERYCHADLDTMTAGLTAIENMAQKKAR